MGVPAPAPRFFVLELPLCPELLDRIEVDPELGTWVRRQSIPTELAVFDQSADRTATDPKQLHGFRGGHYFPIQFCHKSTVLSFTYLPLLQQHMCVYRRRTDYAMAAMLGNRQMVAIREDRMTRLNAAFYSAYDTKCKGCHE